LIAKSAASKNNTILIAVVPEAPRLKCARTRCNFHPLVGPMVKTRARSPVTNVAPGNTVFGAGKSAG
jgi:hypothetical protein